MKNEPVEEPKKLSDFYDKAHKHKHNKEKKVFRIACDWEVCGTMCIEANSLEEAIEQVEEFAPLAALPVNDEYIDGSFKVNKEMTDHFYREDHK